MSAFKYFLFCMGTYVLMLILYAWQRKREWQDWRRCSEGLKQKCGFFGWLIIKPMQVLAFPCKWSVDVIDWCWQGFFQCCENFFGVRTPVCWGRTKRCGEHCCAGCFYSSVRAVHFVDELAEAEAAKRVANGSSPKDLKDRAIKRATTWSGEDDLPDGVEILEEASAFVDGWRAPYTALRDIVAEEINRQIVATCNKDSDYDEESQHFLARDNKNLGKEQQADEEWALHSIFLRAGPMENVTRLLKLIVRTGDPLESKRHTAVKFNLQQAVKERLNWARQKNTPKHLHYALLVAVNLGQSKLKETVEAGKLYAEQRQLPPDWNVIQMLGDTGYGNQMIMKKRVAGGFMGLYTLPGTLAASLQQLLDDTFVQKYTRDRGDGEVPHRLVYVGARLVQNEPNWVEYVQRRTEILQAIQANKLAPGNIYPPRTMESRAVRSLPPLLSEVQEAWLWHGTSAEGAEGITTGDFRINLAGSGAGTLYGRGIYLAECCSKSDEYTKEQGAEHYLLLCRATLGRIYYTEERRPDTNNLENLCKSGQFDAVLGDRVKTSNTYREYMVYDDDQVYPAYIVKYRRQYYNS